jgi:hypothetical protein
LPASQAVRRFRPDERSAQASSSLHPPMMYLGAFQAGASAAGVSCGSVTGAIFTPNGDFKEFFMRRSSDSIVATASKSPLEQCRPITPQ